MQLQLHLETASRRASPAQAVFYLTGVELANLLLDDYFMDNFVIILFFLTIQTDILLIFGTFWTHDGLYIPICLGCFLVRCFLDKELDRKEFLYQSDQFLNQQFTRLL